MRVFMMSYKFDLTNMQRMIEKIVVQTLNLVIESRKSENLNDDDKAELRHRYLARFEPIGVAIEETSMKIKNSQMTKVQLFTLCSSKFSIEEFICLLEKLRCGKIKEYNIVDKQKSSTDYTRTVTDGIFLGILTILKEGIASSRSLEECVASAYDFIQQFSACGIFFSDIMNFYESDSEFILHLFSLMLMTNNNLDLEKHGFYESYTLSLNGENYNEIAARKSLILPKVYLPGMMKLYECDKKKNTAVAKR